ncbi:hypothetical protein RJO89_000300 [Enterobacter asburiae]|nr:hypothetical protein [Enterobacter asburiae]ELC7391334.1 hypothetical protein [Enterobacter asburiae]MBR8502052.1 hypothetical protein [Enterobacter asburiae]MCC2873776.1 hypothetical protein [Enterobacter asburiae]MCZ9445041.1 hypothetical protein [Enterobacter asburiae]MCZ9522074.1 hypothetical protein [Enterobacter asburiae]
MPDISAGHPIAKTFLPHQRVTTEGKGMEIVVRVTVAELEESEMSTGELHSAVLEDLDSHRDYPLFNVKIEIVSQQE